MILVWFIKPEGGAPRTGGGGGQSLQASWNGLAGKERLACPDLHLHLADMVLVTRVEKSNPGEGET